MNRFWRLSIWISRAALAVAIFDFGVMALASMLEPVMIAWNRGIGMWTNTAITTARVQFGVYPLAMMMISAYCLLSPRRHLAGLGFLTTVSLMTLIGYSAGLYLDGLSHRSLLLVERHILTTAIYAIGLATEWRRRRIEDLPHPQLATVSI